MATHAVITLDDAINVFDEPLESCSTSPLTGFVRDGCCNTCDEDVGSHTVCVHVTREFLDYSKAAGNDLSTPHPDWGFPGLNPGDKWCLCASRWLQAYESDKAPRVLLKRTHKRALETIPFNLLMKFALDIN